jgi:hypothetical protein
VDSKARQTGTRITYAAANAVLFSAMGFVAERNFASLRSGVFHHTDFGILAHKQIHKLGYGTVYCRSHEIG